MDYKEAFKALYEDAKEKYDIQQAPKLILRKDEKNSDMLFGRTAYYQPETQTIVVYTTNRHPKDVLRSYCHEMIHHVQNERGDLRMSDSIPPPEPDIIKEDVISLVGPIAVPSPLLNLPIVMCEIDACGVPSADAEV